MRVEYLRSRTSGFNGVLRRAAALLRSHRFLLTLLASQYVVIQLLTGVLYGDAPRNLHFGILTSEQPRFLLDTPDTKERIKGFPPEPSTLSPRELYRKPQTSLHPWWGPVAPLLFAAVWSLTHSYLLLQLVIPLAGAGVVLLTYRFACELYSSREALLAAAFLACFPLFRDYASTSYTEALSTLCLTGALFAYWRGKTLLTVLLGTLSALNKMDLLVLYFGVVGVMAVYVILFREHRLPLRHHLASLIVPAVLSTPWIWSHYLGGGSADRSSGQSFAMFSVVAPQMLELLFYIPWYGGLVAVAAIGLCFVAALRANGSPRSIKLLLASWSGAGLFVLLVYAATPGAGNSPRIMLPALPAIALLFASGFYVLTPAWQRRIGLFLGALFAAVNLFVIGYYALQGAELRSYEPVWRVLREKPAGFVLTEKYWETILYTRQPATWFEGDTIFQHNIMDDPVNFARYVELNPIRYVVLPARGDIASQAVYAYLDTHANRTPAGRYIIYTLR